MNGVEVKDLSFGYGRREVLHDVSLRFAPGLTAVIGPNAAGKTTLLREIAKSVRRSGVPTAYLPQAAPAQSHLTVRETVLLGLLDRLTWHVPSALERKVDAALAAFGLDALAARRLDELSGGQLQLVLVARTFVGEAPVVLLDEVTNSLDLRRQIEVLESVRRETARRGCVTVAVLHDLSLVARFADRAVLLHDGRVLSDGRPCDVFASPAFAEAYGLRVEMLAASDGTPVVAPTTTR